MERALKYFTRKLFDAQTAASRATWMKRLAAYTEEWQQNEARVPRSAVDFHRSMRLHDEPLRHAAYARRPLGLHELELLVGTIRITFSGVRKQTCWSAAGGQSWLYSELYPAGVGQFSLQVLFEDAESEVVAAKVRCFDERTKQLIVDAEDPLPTKSERIRKARSARQPKRRTSRDSHGRT
jgi:hypothetical protein